MRLLVAKLALSEKFSFAFTLATVSSLQQINGLDSKNAQAEMNEEIKKSLLAVSDPEKYQLLLDSTGDIPDFDELLNDTKNNGELIELLKRDLIQNLSKGWLNFEIVEINTEVDETFDQLIAGDYIAQYTGEAFLAEYKALRTIIDSDKSDEKKAFSQLSENFRLEFFQNNDFYMSEFQRLVPENELPEYLHHKKYEFSKLLQKLKDNNNVNEFLTHYLLHRIAHLVQYKA